MKAEDLRNGFLKYMERWGATPGKSNSLDYYISDFSFLVEFYPKGDKYTVEVSRGEQSIIKELEVPYRQSKKDKTPEWDKVSEANNQLARELLEPTEP